MSLIREKTSTRMTEANRANGKRSTGPRTAQGIRNSSQNATKHGILAEKLPLGISELGENVADFRSLRKDLEETFQPEDGFERLLVSDMVGIRWRLMRAWRAEVEAQIQRGRSAKDKQVSRDSESWVSEIDLDRFVRYEGHLERLFERKLQQFLVWRRDRGGPSVMTIDNIIGHWGSVKRLEPACGSGEHGSQQTALGTEN